MSGEPVDGGLQCLTNHLTDFNVYSVYVGTGSNKTADTGAEGLAGVSPGIRGEKGVAPLHSSCVSVSFMHQYRDNTYHFVHTLK